MKSLIRKLLSQEFINNFYHLPKAILANIVYGFPSRGMTVIGVTGTDGKTTTVNMIYRILLGAGKKVSMISTINAKIAGNSFNTGFHVTSPDPFMVQRYLKKAKEHGDEYLILEVTSHALDQNRFWGINFNIGVVTNITHEHLDYHKTFENYFKTKLLLLKNIGVGIINIGLTKTSHNITTVKDMGIKKMVTFGFDKGDFNQKKIGLKLKIPGDYNIENALAAFAAVSSLGINEKFIRTTLNNFSNLIGRMEEIKNNERSSSTNKGVKVTVDFAHTPNALENALKTLRKQTRGRLIAVFGCAGLRDAEKRPLMGAVSIKLADITVITAEDPRGQLEKINQQILEGAKKSGGILNKNVYIIPDRGEAIKFAISLAKRGDLVGIFGKGHEKSMNLDGKTEIPWSDQEEVKKALK